MAARARRAWVLGLLISAPHGLRAQTTPEASEEVVVTGTRAPESAQRATVRTGVVTRDEAERRGATNVGEALAGETTLQVNPESYGYLGRPSGAQIQGLDAERILVLEDGERVIGDEGGVVDLAQLSLVDVDRIEYVAGPTSSLYGTNALGGVINVVGAKPRSYGPSLRYRAEGRATGEWLGQASSAYRGDQSWAALDTAWHERPAIQLDDSRPDSYAPRWRSTTLGLRAGVSPVRRMELKLRARWVRDRSDGLVSETAPGLGRYETDLPSVTDRFGVRVQETLDLRQGRRLSFSLARNWFIDDASRDRRDSPLDETRKRRLQSQGLESAVTLPEGASRVWSFGIRSDAEQLRQTLERTRPDLSRETVVEMEPTQLASGALFGQLSWRLADMLTLLPGARAELHQRYGSVIAPRLAAALQPRPWLGVRAALGRGFRAPTAKELGFLFDHSALGYRILGNTELRPETSWGLNGDVSVESGPVRLRAGAFVNWVDDLITTDVAPTQASPTVTDYAYLNIAQARTAGADASLRARPVDSLELDAGYSYVWTLDVTEDQPLPNRPSHTVTLGSAFTLAGLTASLRFRYVSDAFSATEDEPELRSPPFGLLDARVAYRLFPALEAYVGSLNLGDVRREAGRVEDTRPALGRQWLVGIRGELAADP